MTKQLVVLTNPHPLLRQRALEVDAQTITRLHEQGFFDALIATMLVEDGVGLAAIQVGHLLRVIAVLEGDLPCVYINPVITSTSLRSEVDMEGCLSVPGVAGLVRRARGCTMHALDRSGQAVVRKVKGLTARIYQHEIDHLNGVLFIDRAEKLFQEDRETQSPA